MPIKYECSECQEEFILEKNAVDFHLERGGVICCPYCKSEYVIEK